MSAYQFLWLVTGTANEERCMKELSSFTNIEAGVGKVQEGVEEGRNISNSCLSLVGIGIMESSNQF